MIVKFDKIQRGERKFADYILYYKSNKPIAIIEAKDNNHSVGAGMQQGLDYGEILDIPYVFSYVTPENMFYQLSLEKV